MKINVPVLVLDGDCMDETIDPCSTKTKVRAYIEALNMRKFGTLIPKGFGEEREDMNMQTGTYGKTAQSLAS